MEIEIFDEIVSILKKEFVRLIDKAEMQKDEIDSLNDEISELEDSVNDDEAFSRELNEQAKYDLFVEHHEKFTLEDFEQFLTSKNIFI